MEKNNAIDWATPSLKEEPYWREGMSVEEFETEREYYLKNWKRWEKEKYIPLWKQA